MPFSKFIEIGRVCQINYGPDAGKLCVVVALINGFSVLVDGPEPLTGIKRQKQNLKRLSLTDIVIDIKVNARQKTVVAAWKKADVDAQWAASDMGKKFIINQKRNSMTDFDRFKVRHARKELNKLIQAEMKAVAA